SPSPVTPQLWVPPALTVLNVTPPETSTGALWSLSEPSPSRPSSLLPQHQARPSASSAQAWSQPTLSDRKRWLPDTRRGVSTSLPKDPEPACPLSFAPQHQAEPAASSAHA